LNRDLKKIVVIEKDKHKIKNGENAIFLKEFQGDPEDKELYELLPMLECKRFSISLKSNQRFLL
jgi:TFIIF-interacting CTD phosphatase-like protein